MARSKLAVIVDSNRRDSLNRRLARALETLARPKTDCTRAPIDDMPMFNQDLEEDLPLAVRRFKAEVEGSDGLLFVTPEHNRSIPAVLKKRDRLGHAAPGQELVARQGCRSPAPPRARSAPESHSSTYGRFSAPSASWSWAAKRTLPSSQA